MKVQLIIQKAMRKTGRGSSTHETVLGVIADNSDSSRFYQTAKSFDGLPDTIKVVRWTTVRQAEVFESAEAYEAAIAKRRTADLAAAVISKLTAEQIAALTAAGILKMPQSETEAQAVADEAEAFEVEEVEKFE